MDEMAGLRRAPRCQDAGQPSQLKRYGFKRTGETLQLYTVVYDRAPEPKISCEKPPFAVLTRQK